MASSSSSSPYLKSYSIDISKPPRKPRMLRMQPWKPKPKAIPGPLVPARVFPGGSRMRELQAHMRELQERKEAYIADERDIDCMLEVDKEIFDLQAQIDEHAKLIADRAEMQRQEKTARMRNARVLELPYEL
jgi:hypothetical protein